MKDMKPLQVGRVIENNAYYNQYVMRTSSTMNYEVMALTEAEVDKC